MVRNMICIICPRGCALTADITENGVTVTGNACPKGAEYAINECTNPVRTVTATVRVSNRYNTAAPVAKSRMMEVMAALRQTQVEAPVAIGDVVLEDICGTSVVITKAVE